MTAIEPLLRAADFEAVTGILPQSLKPGLVGLAILVLVAIKRALLGVCTRLSKRSTMPTSLHGLATG